MSIEQINRIQTIQAASSYKKINQVEKKDAVDSKDSVVISDKAKYLSNVDKVKEIVKDQPEIRSEKIAEVMEKIKNGTYLTDKIAEKVAEKIADLLI